MTVRILVVEDDTTTAELVAVSLRHAGHQVFVEHSGADAMARLERESFDLCVLDVMLPGHDGHELCARIRERSDAGIVFLTARTQEQHRIEGLQMGADDYITKPFSLAELVARVEAVLRRVPQSKTPPLVCGDVRLEMDAHRVYCRDREIRLTPSEFAIVSELLQRRGRAMSRAQLLSALPGEHHDQLDRVIDVHVRNIRRKVSDTGSSTTLVETVYGVGYRAGSP